MLLPLGFVFAGAFVLGVAVEASDMFVPVLAFVAGVVALLWIWTESHRVALLGFLFILTLVAGAIRVSGSEPFPQAPPELSNVASFTGLVVDVPRRYPTTTTTRIDIESPSQGRVWAQLPSYPAIEQGDRLTIRGSFTPSEYSSFRGFASQRDTTGVLHAEQVRITANQAPRMQRWRASVSNEISSRLRERIPEPAGAFATGVILGDDGAMTEATRDSFRVGGLTHMTAVSGVHVGIVAAGLLLLSRLGLISRWWMLGLSVPVIWSFAYLVGMRPSVVRASIMLTLLVIAHLLGRPRDTLNAVGIAAAIMLMVDPSFRHDIGFQLSVAATVGIASGILLVGARSHWHLVWVVPLAAQMATEPLILYHFGYYSIVSPVANILAAPFLALTMAMSILTVLTSFVSSFLADALAIGTWVPSYTVVLIADWAASLPYLSGDVQPLSLNGVWLGYIFLITITGVLLVVLRDENGEQDSDFSLLYRV
jgi:competence protein ComEC